MREQTAATGDLSVCMCGVWGHEGNMEAAAVLRRHVIKRRGNVERVLGPVNCDAAKSPQSKIKLARARPRGVWVVGVLW
jgi:hypothetical protein